MDKQNTKFNGRDGGKIKQNHNNNKNRIMF